MLLAPCERYDAVLCLTDGAPVFDDPALDDAFAAQGDAVDAGFLRTMRLRLPDGWCDLILAPKGTAAPEISDALNRLRAGSVLLAPSCGRLLVSRHGYNVHLGTFSGTCPNCGEPIAGVWQER